MEKVYSIILNCRLGPDFCDELLFFPSVRWVEDTLRATGLTKITTLSDTELPCTPDIPLPGDASTLKALKNAAETLHAGSSVLFLLSPLAALSKRTLHAMLARQNGSVLFAYQSNTPVAAFAPAETILTCDNLNDLFSSLSPVQPDYEEETLTPSIACLSDLTAFLRRRTNRRLARKGVFIMDSDSTFISPEADIAPGAVIFPNTLICGKSFVGAGAAIGPNSFLESASVGAGTRVNNAQICNSSVGENSTVGPFAYIRPDCILGDGVRIGDFVELKNAHIGHGSKVPHLAYVGDARVGERVNFGCGVITANYDGSKKHITTVEDDVFIGCNSNLVAPVTIRRGSYTACGSTVTEEVPEDALYIARAKGTVKKGWAAKWHETHPKKKK